MTEEKIISLATGQELPEVKEATGVTVIKRVMETAITNRKVIDEKKAKASAIIDAIVKKIPQIKTEDNKTDEYVEKAIVATSNVLVDIEKLRKAYTGTVREWLSGEIGPENELKLEIQKLRDLRNDRAKRIREQADKRQKEIDAQKNKEIYESNVKKEMKFQHEKGIIDKIVAFEESIANHFKKLTVANAPTMKAQLESLKPNLKEEVFLSWFQVDYDQTKMTPDEYDALVKRAKTFWVYETINAKYVTETTTIIKKWLDKIPQKVKELQAIAAGGEQGERVKKIVAEREAAETEEFKKEAETKLNQTTHAINEEAFKEQNSAEFKAQAQTQGIPKSTAATRQESFYVLDNPADIKQLSLIVGSIIMHTIMHKSAEEKTKMVLQIGADGRPKKDEDGNPMYTVGVQYWLDIAATFGYKPDIAGITLRHKVKAINKAKK